MSDRPRYEIRETTTPTNEAPASPVLDGPELVYELCGSLARQRVEGFQVFLLDAQHHLIRKVTVSRGTINASLVHPREVFRPAIVASCAPASSWASLSSTTSWS